MAAILRQEDELLGPMEREALRIRFAVALAAMANIAVYWSPSRRRIFARTLPHDEASLFLPGNRRVPIPRDCVRVGCYLHPFSSGAFIDDLCETIRILHRHG